MIEKNTLFEGDVLLLKLPKYGRQLGIFQSGAFYSRKKDSTDIFIQCAFDPEHSEFVIKDTMVIKNFGQIDITKFEEEYPEWSL